jgi:hypothetical protein
MLSRWLPAVVVVTGVLCAGAPLRAEPAAVDPAVVLELVPRAASGNHIIVGNEIILDAGGQSVEIEVLVRDWDTDGNGDPALDGVQTRLDCADFHSGSEGQLVPSNEDFTPGPTVPFGMGIDETRTDYLLADAATSLPFCNTVDCCDGTQPPCLACDGSGEPCEDAADCPAGESCNVPVEVGYYGCILGIFIGDPVEDDGTAKYVTTYSFAVTADAAGTFTVGLDPDPDQTLVNAGPPLSPVLIMPALITIESPACDFDVDDDVDMEDMAAFQRCFGETGGGDCWLGDMSGNGLIDLDDYALCFAEFQGP